MKKLFTLILALALILPAATLADPDVKSMTDQQLRDLISACSAELQARATTPEGWILLFEYEGSAVYQIGEAKVSSSKKYLNVPVAVVNNTDQSITFSPSYTTCNGWEINTFGCDASGNAKKKTELIFSLEDAEVQSLDEITSLKFLWIVYDGNFHTLFKEETPTEHRFW